MQSSTNRGSADQDEKQIGIKQFFASVLAEVEYSPPPCSLHVGPAPPLFGHWWNGVARKLSADCARGGGIKPGASQKCCWCEWTVDGKHRMVCLEAKNLHVGLYDRPGNVNRVAGSVHVR